MHVCRYVCAVNILIPSVFLTFFLSFSYQQITGADWGSRHFCLKSGRWTVGISVSDQGDGQLPFLSTLCHSSDYFLFLCFSLVLWFNFTHGALHCDESPVRFPLSLGWSTMRTGFLPCMPPHRSYTSDLPPQELKKTSATGSCSGIYWNGFAQNYESVASSGCVKVGAIKKWCPASFTLRTGKAFLQSQKAAAVCPDWGHITWCMSCSVSWLKTYHLVCVRYALTSMSPSGQAQC